MDNQFDVVIVGGGLVGISAAVALAIQGHQVALVDRKAPNFQSIPEGDAEDWDSRIYAISPGNVAWLKALDVWRFLDQARVCPIGDMEIWGDDTREPLRFESYEANAENLGVILENSQLQQALWSRMIALGVHVEVGIECSALTFLPESAQLKLADGRLVTTKLVIAADGGNSWVRSQAGISTQLYQYEQMGVVANFEVELPHNNVARQWFREDGILAWLPLPGNRISMVWSTANASELLTLDSQALAAKVAEAGCYTLGGLQTITPAQAFPLVKQTADKLVQSRLALVGDAAHQVHPLAGQGVNLGFRDVIMLASALAVRNQYQDIGDLSLLRRYERARKSDMLALRYVTHGLQSLFENKQPRIKKLRNVGLSLTNHQIWLKRLLIKRAII